MEPVPGPPPLAPTTPFKGVVGSLGTQVGGAGNRKARAGDRSVFPVPHWGKKFPLNWASIQEAKVKGDCVSRTRPATGRSLGWTSFVDRSRVGGGVVLVA